MQRNYREDYLRKEKVIPEKLREKVDRELGPGEYIRWSDMPVPGFFTPSSVAVFLFSIPWTLFAIFWMFGAAEFKMPDFNDIHGFFPLFGLPFVLIGLALFASPLWVYRKALKTVYVITNRRAITIVGGRTVTIHSYPPDKLQNIYRKEKSDGTGDVIFNKKEWLDSGGESHKEYLKFSRINNPKEAERLLKKLAEQGTSI